MANYNKSFNFRNGLQVDDDNFIINSNGLVGIGTTVPREILDVHGILKVTGIISTTESIFASTFISADASTSSLNVGIVSISLGIVTASSGVVTYFGDGGNLINLPTSQWIDVNSGFGYTSIYAVGNVGVATIYPAFTFQVGGNNNSSFGQFANGVGINSTGSILATGIITASSFRNYNVLVGTASSTTTTFVVTVAAKTTNHRYYGTGSANAYVIDGIESPFLTLLPGKTYRFTQEDGTNSGHPLVFYYEASKTTQYSTNVTTSGTPGTAGAYTEIVVTDTTPVVLHYQCSVHGYMGNAAQFNSNVVDTSYQITTRSGLSVTGVSTFAGIATITGTTLFTNQLSVSGLSTFVGVTTNQSTIFGTQLSVSGISTFSGAIDANGDTELDNVNISGITTFAGAIDANSDLDVDGHTELDNVNISGITTFAGAIDANGDLDVDGHTELDNVSVSGVSTFVGVTTNQSTIFGTQLSVSGISTFNNFIIAPSLRNYSSLVGTASSTTTTFDVTVASKTTNHRYFGTGSALGYYIDGIESPFLTLLPGKTYRFNQEDGSNNTHSIVFYYDAARTTQYSTNVTTNGTAGFPGAYTQIVVTDTTPVVLYYQCTNQVEDEDGYMGNAAQFNSNVVDTMHQITARSGLSVTGVSTFSGGIQGNVIGNITGNVTGNITGNLTGTATTASSLTATADVDIADLTVGVATVSTRLYAEQIGVGTNSSSSDIHLLRSSSATLQVTSDTAEAIVAVGRSSTLDGNNGALIFGNTVGVYPYSLGGNTLDIVNYGTGNLNAYLDYGTAGVGTGNFNWIYGQDPTDTLMSLTYQGNLGLGVTNPTNKLHVVGTSTITDNAFFGQNINVSGNTNISGNLNLLGGGSLNANLTGNVSGNVNSTVGISTFNNISVTNDLSSFKSFIGIGTEASDPSYEFQVSDQFFVSSSGIGIGTNTRIANIGISALDADAVFKSVGIGTTVSQSALTVVGGAIISGVTTSLGGFTSELLSNPVKITVSGSILTFTVPGVGTTSLTLF